MDGRMGGQSASHITGWNATVKVKQQQQQQQQQQQKWREKKDKTGEIEMGNRWNKIKREMIDYVDENGVDVVREAVALERGQIRPEIIRCGAQENDSNDHNALEKLDKSQGRKQHQWQWWGLDNAAIVGWIMGQESRSKEEEEEEAATLPLIISFASPLIPSRQLENVPPCFGIQFAMSGIAYLLISCWYIVRLMIIYDWIHRVWFYGGVFDWFWLCGTDDVWFGFDFRVGVCWIWEGVIASELAVGLI